jgi:hypothetical protein
MKPTEALDIRANFKSRCTDARWREVIKTNIMLSSGAKFYQGNLVSIHHQDEDADLREKAIDVYVDDIIRAGISGECFFIKEEMTDLVLFASEKLDETDLFDPTLAPTDKGFAYFEKPVPLTDVRGRKLLINILTWEKIFHPETGNFQTTISCWNDTARTPDEVALELMSHKDKGYRNFVRELGRFQWIKSQSINSGTIVGAKQLELSEKELQAIRDTTFKNSYGVADKDIYEVPITKELIDKAINNPAERNRETGDALQKALGYNKLSDEEWEEYKSRMITNPTNLVRILHSYWLLMSQTLVEQSKETGDRTQRRRLEREKCPTDVIVVQFRKRKYVNERGEETEESKKIDWSHRWIVGGHWRWQPYKDPASGGEIKKRIWISPYVKGPEDKPLVAKSKVFVLAK